MDEYTISLRHYICNGCGREWWIRPKHWIEFTAKHPTWAVDCPYCSTRADGAPYSVDSATISEAIV